MLDIQHAISPVKQGLQKVLMLTFLDDSWAKFFFELLNKAVRNLGSCSQIPIFHATQLLKRRKMILPCLFLHLVPLLMQML